MCFSAANQLTLVACDIAGTQTVREIAPTKVDTAASEAGFLFIYRQPTTVTS
jgi:uncharacterized protein YunC (DUF1805 family)